MGAIGFGAASVMLMPTAMLDVVGVFSASAILLGSLYILPYKRAKVKKQFRENVNQLRTLLSDRLQQQFVQDLDESISSILHAISPYSRFIKIENKKFQEYRAKLNNIQSDIASIRRAINNLSDSDEK